MSSHNLSHEESVDDKIFRLSHQILEFRERLN
jgi:hypothetical protein